MSDALNEIKLSMGGFGRYVLIGQEEPTNPFRHSYVIRRDVAEPDPNDQVSIEISRVKDELMPAISIMPVCELTSCRDLRYQLGDLLFLALNHAIHADNA